MHHLAETLALMAVLGIGAQWLGARLRIPVILLLILFGLLMGPAFGLIRPGEDLGEAFQPLVRLAVALILFEGGLSLRIDELRQAGKGLIRLSFITVILSWLFAAAAAYWIADLSWAVSVVLGATTVVTGPTVVLPLLRQARLRRRPAAFLKWDGIVNDPAGAVLSVVAFQYFIAAGRSSIGDSLIELLIGLVTAVVLGTLVARLLGRAFLAGQVPEYLKGPVALAAALGVYGLSNLVLEEAGLVSATVLGVVLANMGLPSIEEIRRFKSYMSVLLVSALFLLLTADLDASVMLELNWRSAAFIAALIFLVRPLAVGLATIGAGMTWQERVLAGWIAPRGVVAAAVAGVFGPALGAQGNGGSELMLPLTFALIVSTVLLHGLSLGWLARRLDLSAPGSGGLLIAGANPWSRDLAKALHEQEVPVLVADQSRDRLRALRYAGVPVYQGELLSQHAESSLELGEMESLLAATENDAYNVLVCARFAPDLGRQSVLQLAETEPSEELRPAPTTRGRTAFSDDVRFEDLERDWIRGFSFHATRITDEFDVEDLLAGLPEGALPLAVIEEGNRVRLLEAGERLDAVPGDRVLWYGCKGGCLPLKGVGGP